MASKCTTEKRGKRHMEIIAIYTGAYSASKIFKYNNNKLCQAPLTYWAAL